MVFSYVSSHWRAVVLGYRELWIFGLVQGGTDNELVMVEVVLRKNAGGTDTGGSSGGDILLVAADSEGKDAEHNSHLPDVGLAIMLDPNTSQNGHDDFLAST